MKKHLFITFTVLLTIFGLLIFSCTLQPDNNTDIQNIETEIKNNTENENKEDNQSESTTSKKETEDDSTTKKSDDKNTTENEDKNDNTSSSNDTEKQSKTDNSTYDNEIIDEQTFYAPEKQVLYILDSDTELTYYCFKNIYSFEVTFNLTFSTEYETDNTDYLSNTVKEFMINNNYAITITYIESTDNYDKYIVNRRSNDKFYLSALSVVTNTNNTTNNESINLYGLYLVADDGKNTFLGSFENEYATNSIYNSFGNYGSAYSINSIMNKFGTYGSDYSNYSPFNQFATNAPLIVDDYGNIYGRLSLNKYAIGVTTQTYNLALELKALRDSR